jgi:ATP-binding cassette subfamily B protein
MRPDRPSWRRSVGLAIAMSWREAPVSTVLLYVATAVAGFLPAVTAWTFKELIDTISAAGGASTARVAWLAVITALAGLGTPLLSALVSYISLAISSAVTVAAEDTLFRAVNRQAGLCCFEQPVFLDRLRLAEQAAGAAPSTVNDFTLTGVQAAAAMAGFGGVLFVIWPPVALLLLVACAVDVVAQVRLSRLRVRTAEAMSATIRQQYVYRQLLTDDRAVKESRLFGLTSHFRGRMIDALRTATHAQLCVERRSVLVTARTTVACSAVSTIGLVVVAVRVAHGELTLGELTLFLAAAVSVQSSAIGLVASYGHAAAAVDLLRHYLWVRDLPADIEPGERTPTALNDSIEFRDVWFRYHDGPWILRGVNMRIPAGTSAGLVGVNGAGKSTLVKLVARFYDPQRGQILWDGTDIREFDLAALRCRLGATFQDYMHYDLSVAENIGIGDLAASGDRDRIEDAARQAGIWPTINALPGRFDTLLSRSFDDEQAGATTLSGGQWQRIALARTLMRAQADLVILDEPSSGLDPEAEHDIHATLRAQCQGRTTLLISHRLSALCDADVIHVLDGGVVAESGHHRDLLARRGRYAALFQLQARGYTDPAPNEDVAWAR